MAYLIKEEIHLYQAATRVEKVPGTFNLSYVVVVVVSLVAAGVQFLLFFLLTCFSYSFVVTLSLNGFSCAGFWSCNAFYISIHKERSVGFHVILYRSSKRIDISSG